MPRFTIQQVIESGDRVTAYCHNSRCHHNQRLDLEAIRDRLGPDHGGLSPDLVPKLRCSKCGGKEIGLIYSPAGNEVRSENPLRGWGGNAYSKAKDG